MKLAVVYLRVSTDTQDVDTQRLVVDDFARRNGFQVIYFINDGVSGNVPCMSREGFRNMINFLKNNPEIKDIIIYDISRLSRNYDDLKNVINYFIGNDYRIWIATLPTFNDLLKYLDNTSNELTKLLYKLILDLLIDVFSYQAALERELIRERTKAGIRKAKAQGKRIGRPPKVDLEKLKELLAKGLSKGDIARYFKVHESTVYGWLKKIT